MSDKGEAYREKDPDARQNCPCRWIHLTKTAFEYAEKEDDRASVRTTYDASGLFHD